MQRRGHYANNQVHISCNLIRAYNPGQALGKHDHQSRSATGASASRALHGEGGQKASACELVSEKPVGRRPAARTHTQGSSWSNLRQCQLKAQTRPS